MKSIGDSSTIDFAYLPKLFEDSWGPSPAAIRVPILPNVQSDHAEAVLEQYPELDAAAGGYQDTEGHQTLMKAQISHYGQETGSSASVMSDVHDGHHEGELSIEMLTTLTNTVGKSAKEFVDMVKDKDEETIRKIWSGFLDDLFGQKGKGAKP